MEKRERELREKRKKLREAALLALVAIVLAFSATPNGRELWTWLFAISEFSGPSQQSPLRVHVIDVGKADAILLECQGEAVLLDAGTYPRGDTVVDYLQRVGVTELKYVIPSHPDSDHIGGMAQVLQEIPTQEVLTYPWPASLCQSVEYQNLLQATREESLSCRQVLPGDVFSVGEARLQILGPLKTYEDSNNSSLVIRLDFQGFSALFCGDIAYEAEKDLVKSGVDLDVDLLKVPHHGSASSCSSRFLEAVSPAYAAVSAGPDNSHLPREETLRRLEETGAQVCRTDVEGDLVFSWDGETLSLWTERQYNRALEYALEKLVQ